MLRPLILLCSLWGFTFGLPNPLATNSAQGDQLTPISSRDYQVQQPANQYQTPSNQYQTPSNQYQTPVNTYQAPTNQVHTNTGHAGYSSSGGTDVGHSYYHVQEQQEGYGHMAAGAAAGAQQHELMTPLLIIIVLLIAILLQLALPGLLASLAALIGPLLPAIEFQPITVPVPTGSRSFVDNNLINRLTETVISAIEADDCMSRLVCQAARYADGSTSFLAFLENMNLEEYSSYVKIFKDSALRKVDCDYKCGSLGYKKLKKKEEGLFSQFSNKDRP